GSWCRAPVAGSHPTEPSPCASPSLASYRGQPIGARSALSIAGGYLRRRVRAALRAARDRDALERRRALWRAWRASDERDAARCPSRRRALEMARERVAEGRRRDRLWPARYARAALCFVFALP